MADTNTAVDEPKTDTPAPNPPAPAPHHDADAGYRRRAALLGSTRAKWAIAILVLLLIAGGIYAWRYFSSYESTDDAQIDGYINPISARVSGHVMSLNVNDNQYVEKGTLLVELDPADYQVALEKAQAEYADAQAQASAAGINIPVTDVNTSSQVASAQAGVANAKAGVAGCASGSQ